MPLTSSNNKRIARNTLLLYARMLLIMAVTLYTSRVYLQVLGETDFGIYNIVGGIVLLLSFVNTTLTFTIQRFLNYEMGKNEGDVGKVFSTSLVIYILFSLLLLVLGETIGLWFLNYQLNIPTERMFAANCVYQFSLIGFILNMLRMPYQALIIANERMNFYAYFSILEAFLKLSIAILLLKWNSIDKLIQLSFLTAIVYSIITVSYKVYCNKHFVASIFHFVINKYKMKQLLSFSGWSLLGSSANICSTQGINILVNIYCGVVVNAAIGIATQLIQGLNQFVANFQVAYNPQIVKLYASGNKDEFLTLVFRASKFSYFLSLIITLPSMLCMNFILQIWLGNPPEYTIDFCRLIMIYSLIDALSGPLWQSSLAIGDVKRYWILVSSITIINLPLTYIALKMGLSPILAWGIKVIINAIVHIARILYLKYAISFPISDYLKNVIVPLSLVTLMAWPIPLLLNGVYEGWINLFLVSMSSLIIVIVLVLIFGLNKSERNMVNSIVYNHVLHRLR